MPTVKRRPFGKWKELWKADRIVPVLLLQGQRLPFCKYPDVGFFQSSLPAWRFCRWFFPASREQHEALGDKVKVFGCVRY